jgi:hypothetical protein
VANDPVANAPAPTNANPAQNSAMAVIQQMLDQSGLGSLATFAWSLITQDATVDEITTQIRNTATVQGPLRRQRPAPERRQAAPQRG